MRTLPAQTTISESPKHPDDGPGVRAGRVSCLKLSLITLRIDPYDCVFEKVFVMLQRRLLVLKC